MFDWPYSYKPNLSLRWFKSHSSQAIRLVQCLLRGNFAIQIGSHVAEPDTLYRRTVNKTTWSNPRYNMELFHFSVWVFETPNERAIEYLSWTSVWTRVISRSIFNATRTGNGWNKILRTGNGFNKVIMYILPSKQEREILFEATRTCVWLKLDFCSMCVRFATQQRDTSRLINYHVTEMFCQSEQRFHHFLT